MIFFVLLYVVSIFGDDTVLIDAGVQAALPLAATLDDTDERTFLVFLGVILFVLLLALAFGVGFYFGRATGRRAPATMRSNTHLIDIMTTNNASTTAMPTPAAHRQLSAVAVQQAMVAQQQQLARQHEPANSTALDHFRIKRSK